MASCNCLHAIKNSLFYVYAGSLMFSWECALPNNITQIMNVTACYLIFQNVFYEEIVSGCAICKNETDAATPENVPCGKKTAIFCVCASLF